MRQGGDVSMSTTPQRGDFVRVRTRRWMVEDERSAGEGLTALRLACVDDDAQGEMVEVLWDAEPDGSVLKDEGWAAVRRRIEAALPTPLIDIDRYAGTDRDDADPHVAVIGVPA